MLSMQAGHNYWFLSFRVERYVMFNG
jgi:hypothetical protein